ncbi:MAG: lysophospholipid acyltransferase family protein [Kiritimatiellae bacterium]|nr:lysophospholipid acyltransferase family protein [Kiritimatiellia bacterium]
MPLSFTYWLGLRVADYFYFRDRAGRAAVADNLRHILTFRGIQPTERMVRNQVRKTYQYFGKYLVDFFRFSKTHADWLNRRVSTQHLDRLDAELQRGKGVIITTAHLGNWEVGGCVLATQGYPLTAVFRPFGIPHLDRMFTQYRSSRGMKMVPLGNSVRALLNTLRAGECIVLLTDRDFTGLARPVSFFGAPAPLPDGAARLAWKTGAPIIPCYVTRRVDDSFLLSMDEAIHPEDHSSADDIQRSVSRSMENAIGEYPHQWFIFRPYWNGAAGSGASAPAHPDTTTAH